MRYLYIIFNLLIGTLAYAQTEKTFESAFGSVVEIPFAANDQLQKVKIIYQSPKNQPIGFTFNISAPADTQISFDYMGYPQGKSLEQAISSSRSLNQAMIAFSEGKYLTKLTVGKAESASGGGGRLSGYICNGRIDASYIDFYRGIVRAALGHEPSTAEICKYLFPNDVEDQGGGEQSNSSPATVQDVTVVGVLYKDACVNNLSYFGILTLDLSKISAENRAAGFKISVSSKGSARSGSKKFKVKRMGDGKFKEPLFLGESIGSGSSTYEYHLFTRWTSGKLKSKTKLSMAKTTSYRGASLIITRARKVLTGGKATVFATNDDQAYGVCIKAVASDQRYNGYTN